MFSYLYYGVVLLFSRMNSLAPNIICLYRMRSIIWQGRNIIAKLESLRFEAEAEPTLHLAYCNRIRAWRYILLCPCRSILL
jgi:hypothetical protein